MIFQSKPFGFSELIISTEKYSGNMVYVHRNQASPIIFHEKLDKTIYILSGFLSLFFLDWPYQLTDITDGVLFKLEEEWEKNKQNIFLEDYSSFRIRPFTLYSFGAIKNTYFIEFSNELTVGDRFEVAKSHSN